jgi:hypothetical protein
MHEKFCMSALSQRPGVLTKATQFGAEPGHGANNRENVMKQPQGLIELLLDVTAAEADRDDAAMELAAYDAPEVEDALIQVGVDPSTPNSVAASCGESLAEIWIRKKTVNLDALKLLKGETCHEAIGLIRARGPSWSARLE